MLAEYGAIKGLTDKELISKLSIAGFDNWLSEILAKNPDLSSGMNEALGCSALSQIEKLLSVGVSVDKSTESNSPISYVISDCNEVNRLERLKKLIANGAELTTSKEGKTPLMKTVTKLKGEDITAITQFYLEQGVDITAKDNKGRTALMHAAANSNFSGVKVLLENGIKVNELDNEGHSALFYAYFPEIIELLHHNGANLELANHKGFTPLHSVFWGCFGSGQENEEWFAWESSVDQDKCIETTITLLDLGANPNARDENGMSPFMHLMGVDFRYPYRNDGTVKAIYQHFIDSGADLELRDNKGLTASLHAAKVNLSFWYKHLLETGIDINVQDFEGNNILILSTEQVLQSSYSYGSLRGYDIPLNVRNNKGETALIHLAKLMAKEKEERGLLELRISDYSSIFEELILIGVDPTLKDNKGKTVADYLATIEEFHDTNVYKYGLTQRDIFTYARTGNLTELQNLIEQGADVNAYSTTKMPIVPYGKITVLMAAVMAKQYKAVEMLLAEGAYIDATLGASYYCSLAGTAKRIIPHDIIDDDNNNYGETALSLAVKQDDLEMIKLLIDSGANVNVRDGCILPAIHYSTSDSVVQLLLEAGAFLDYEVLFSYDATACSIDKRTVVRENLLDLIPENYTNISKHIGFGNLDRALRTMVTLGNYKLVKMLLEAGANPKASYKIDLVLCAGLYQFKTALDLALEKENDEIARLLVEFGGEDGEVISKVAAASAYDWLAELLAKNPDLSTGMAEGLGCTTLEGMELLLAAGAHLNKDSENYDPPIVLVLSNCNKEKKLERLEKLLAAGANPNTLNEDGETALMLAARNGYRERLKRFACNDDLDPDLQNRTLLEP